MKKFKLKLISGVILLLVFALLFSSCEGIFTKDKTTDDDSNLTQNSGDDSTDVPVDVVVFADGEFNFTMVRPYEYTSIELEQFNLLRAEFAELSNAKVNQTTDAQYSGHYYSADALEILVGAIEYPECGGLLAKISYNEYGIGFIGNKLVITAWSDAGLASAVEAFIDYIRKNTSDGSLILPADFLLTGTSSAAAIAQFEGMPSYPGGTVKAISDCADDFMQITISNTTAEMFGEYRTLMTGAGYAVYSENTMVDNQFVTYTKSNQTLYAYYTPYSNETRLIASIGANNPWKDSPTYTKVAELSFTMFGLEVGGSTGGGLGCMMQLEDGSFVIIDGGHNTDAEAAQIYTKLMEMAPDKKNIVIRAWVITHAHGDHYGALVKFASKYAKLTTIKVESFIYNLCDTKEQTQYLSGSAVFASVRNIAKNNYPSAKIYKCLTGQVFRFAGADMEILSCMSDFLPGVIGLERSDADLNNADGNIQSLIVRFNSAQGSVIVTGDASKVCIDQMCARFGDYLKSDVLTVPHHGWNENRYRARNGTMEFYRLVNPTVVMWPDSIAAQAKKMIWNGSSGANNEANYYLVYSLNVKQVIVAGSTTHTVILSEIIK